MNIELLGKLLSSFGLLLIGIMAKFSVNDGWKPIKKYWLFFVIAGGFSLVYIMFKYF